MARLPMQGEQGFVSIATALPAGTNNVGDVDVLSLPTAVIAGMTSLPAGANNVGDVDVVTLPTLPAGANNIGTITGSAVEIRDPTTTTRKLAVDASGKIGISALPPLAGGSAIIGTTKKGTCGYTTFHKHVALSTTAETTIWTPTADTKFFITDIFISASAAGTCTLRDGTAGATILIGCFAANGGMVMDLQTPIESATANNVLTAQASAATQYITILGYEY